MTDFEITRLCAEAMFTEYCPPPMYDPLHDDAQAMALVKKFDISISRGGQATESPWWRATIHLRRGCSDKDLNRAICECVAKMQEAK